MKTIISSLTVVAFAFTLSAYAVDEHHPEDQKAAPTNAAPKERAPAPKAATPPKNDKSAVPKTAQAPTSDMPAGMMDNMNKMQQQMQQLMQTHDPKERERLLTEHMQAMQQHMKMMGDMKGSGMMARGTTGASSIPSEKRMQMMEQRMDMMQKMMEQMLQQMDATQKK